MSKKSQKPKLKVILPFLAILGVVALAVWYLRGVNIPVMQPQGLIGHKERNLMVFTVLLGLLIIIPVFAMAIVIAWRYREGNTKVRAKYTPDWDRHRLAEFTWWAIPFAIIAVLSVVTWTSTHNLDPWKPLNNSAKTMKIQVVSLDWKWLFIYPEQQIATVNFVQFPTGTPVDFEITSDSVMNSFWIPQLGSQIYSMPGMSTHVHLAADKNGDYRGSSANISGEGFAGMKFVARASSQASFDAWAKSLQEAPVLDGGNYATLAQPSKNEPPAFYALGDKNLYGTILSKYMASMHHVTPEDPASDEADVPATNHHEHMHMEMAQ
jgi:cytochrome o ubiquinol oxidase subunit 2